MATEDKGECCVCGKETKLHCNSCAYNWGEFSPTWYCDKHYETTVMTGHCCRLNEITYEKQ